MYKGGTLPQGMNAIDAIQALKQKVCVNCLKALKVKGRMWELSPGQVGGVLAAVDIM